MNNTSQTAGESSVPSLTTGQPSAVGLPRIVRPRDPATAAPGDRLRKLAAVLFATALGIAIYLAWQSAAGEVMPGCGPESGCGQILNSRWSVAGGVSVSLLGAGVYALLLISALRRGTVPPWQRQAEWVASGLVLGGALWFTIVQAFILHAFCPWCSAAHLLASAGVGALWVARRKAAAPPHQDRPGLALSALPLIGLPNATMTAVALTDFTCPHCRELHGTLTQLAGQRPGQFSTVLLPAAYEPEARELHRIMLALWRIDAERYRKLSEELASGAVDPNTKTVLELIQQQLDGRFYELAWAQSGWVQDTMRLGEELLALNGRESGAATLPQIMMRDKVLTGSPRPETLTSLLDAPPEPASTTLAASSKPVPAAPAPAAPVTPVSVAAPASHSTAVITFDSATVDLGTVTKGEPAAKKVTFTNTGQEPLTISNIKASCGCTTVQGWQQTVAPGQQGFFELKLDTARFMGAVTKTVDVESNAANGMVRLSLKALIWSPVTINPPMVSFGSLLKGTKIEPRSVEITVTDKEPLKIAGATGNNPYFQTEMNPIEEGRKYRLIVSVPELGERPQNSEIVITLGHPKLKELKIPVYINPVDPMVVQPAQLNIATEALQKGSTASITVFCHDPAVSTLEVTDLTYSGGSDVAVTFERQGNNRWGRVQLNFPAGFNPGDAKDASVSFRTNHPQHAQFTVPVRFIGSARTAVKVPTGILIN